MAARFLKNLGPAFFSPVFLARLFFILLTTWCGMMLAEENIDVELFGGVAIRQRWLYSQLAFFAAVLMTLFEYATGAISSHKILMASFGATAGLIFANLFYRTIPSGLVRAESAQMVCNLIFGYFGIIMAIKHAERFHLSRLKFFLSQDHERPKILDSSVLIDGRIRELIELQVVRGAVLVPEFVIQEIQGIADSSDPNRKARGRRGLDVLQSLRDSCRTLEFVDKDYADVTAVDQKLVRLSRELDGDLLTNDFNLQKIAQLHRITVMNLNEIANALRPMVYIGETLTLNVVREGKEQGQGVGYLEDGTMVVIDEGRALLNHEVTVLVTSILQTSSGRLVFARLREESNLMRA
jgi:uncharacterized protein YacL